LKNHLNKKLVIAYIGSKSILAKSFVKQYYKNFIFKSYFGDIRNHKKIRLWLNKNKDINIMINFAAITSTKVCEKNNKKALDVNYKSVIQLLNLLNNIKMNNFKYFLSLSTSHVFKKSKFKLTEKSERKPSNYYGYTKLTMENYIFKHQGDYNFKIGVARIFNYYSKKPKKGFFINDVLKKLKNKQKIIRFNNINSFRDFISISDINSALFKMINLKLINDYNICSGKKIYLPDIINKLNKKYKNKSIIFDDKSNGSLIGSNIKLKKKGWKISKQKILNEIFK
jgi:nucleoside-diphosphate-sugar epimerase